MNRTHRKFLIGLGLFWLLSSSLMFTTGFDPSLREFGLSERLFWFLAWQVVIAGAVAVLIGVFAGRQKALKDEQ